MRRELKKHAGQRFTVTATFERFGIKSGYMGRQLRTVLLRDVRRGDEVLTDHLWFTCGKTFDRLMLREGDCISFDARVSRYTKGYQGWREDVPQWTAYDYRLERPTKAFKILKDVAA